MRIPSRKTFHTFHTFFYLKVIPEIFLRMPPHAPRPRPGGMGLGAWGQRKARKVWKVWKVFREGIRTRSPEGSLHAEDLKIKLLQVFRRKKKAGKEIYIYFLAGGACR